MDSSLHGNTIFVVVFGHRVDNCMKRRWQRAVQGHPCHDLEDGETLHRYESTRNPYGQVYSY
jgi:hypothetical protein